MSRMDCGWRRNDGSAARAPTPTAEPVHLPQSAGLPGVGIYMDGQDRQDGGPLGRNRALARAMYGGLGARIALDSGFRRNDGDWAR